MNRDEVERILDRDPGGRMCQESKESYFRCWCQPQQETGTTRSTLLLVLSKTTLPQDCVNVLVSFMPLNPPTPTAQLIKQLRFKRDPADNMLWVGNYTMGIRNLSRDNRMICWQRHTFGLPQHWYEYDIVTGEPKPKP